MKRITPTSVTIDLKALRHNFRVLKRRLPKDVKTLCVVKSNAYGHGAVAVARALEKEGCDAFGVGTIDEGVRLREAGIKSPILTLLGYLDDAVADILKFNLTPVIYDEASARKLDAHARRLQRKVDVHLKVDTGMTRLGVLPGEFLDFCRRISSLKNLKPVGLLTHLAEASDPAFTQKQARVFASCEKTFVSFFGEAVFHLANSQASLDRNLGGGPQRMARLGIALYGAYPSLKSEKSEKSKKIFRLQPVLTWSTRLLSLKSVPPGTKIGYNRTFTTKRSSRIGVLPVGYADGYPRLLSNRAQVLVKGRKAPVRGIVCMDLTMIDLTNVPGAKIGDEVILIGRQGNKQITAQDLASMAQTITYEIFCRISERVERVFIG